MTEKTEKKERSEGTLTARQLIKDRSLESYTDEVFRVIHDRGMNSRRLYSGDIELILGYVTGDRKRKSADLADESEPVQMPTTDSSKLILKVRDPVRKVTRYMFAGDLENLDSDSDREDVFLQDFVS